MQTSRNRNHLGRRPFSVAHWVSHSNKSVKNPLTFSSIARASSSDSRWALRGCQNFERAINQIVVGLLYHRNQRLLQRRPELRRARDRSAERLMIDVCSHSKNRYWVRIRSFGESVPPRFISGRSNLKLGGALLGLVLTPEIRFQVVS
jgi:hypothetical protein